MTTPAAEALYLAQHLHSLEGKGFAVFNPLEKPLEELPVIYGFNNGGSAVWLQAVAISQDGTVLGTHICRAEGYMPSGLGMLEGTAQSRHANKYQPHHPEGYRMEFVPSESLEAHVGLQAAFALNKLQKQKAKK